MISKGLVALLLVSTAAAAQSVPIEVAGPWQVRVGPGEVTAGDTQVRVSEPVEIEIAPARTIQVRDEEHGTLPVFNPKAGGWRKGSRLNRLITQECSATGHLLPDTIRLRAAPDATTVFVRGQDYEMDTFWGTVGRIDGGAIAADQPVYVDYDYVPCRLDSISVTADGQVAFVEGEPGVGVLLPPALDEGAVAIANVWFPGPTEALSDDNLYPIDSGVVPAEEGEPQAIRLLPKTLAKLRAGEEVTIVAWGDSVTNGGDVRPHGKEAWYQNQFAALLQARYPKATVTMITASWPGGNSKGYLSAPAGGTYDFVRDVIDPKPDLVTIEFVNDAGLNEEAVQKHYAYILERLQGNGSEVALITPHFVRPDWMGAGTAKIVADPRPYVKGLKRFAKENDVALADASARWGALVRQGIPYMTLEANSINHPDIRGHEMFALSLMELFPED
ncbi:MAG: hypothetical protein GY851_35240 [bacterium]|nr:hypothetical protein [bacterium]